MSWYNHKGSYDKQGRPAEEAFAAKARARGYLVEKSTKQEDCNEHFDWILQVSNTLTTIRVDVKSRKKLNRRDENPNDAFVWVEFKNGEGDPGWLYGGADWIAFEQEGCWLICDREELRKYAESVVDFDEFAREGPKLGVHKLLQRQRTNRHDLTTTLNTVEVCQPHILKDVWSK
jgi:hypothetical protein